MRETANIYNIDEHAHTSVMVPSKQHNTYLSIPARHNSGTKPCAYIESNPYYQMVSLAATLWSTS